MKKSKIALAIMAVVLTGSIAFADVPFQDGYTGIFLATSPRQLGAGEDFPGMWEYVYDVIGTTDGGGSNYTWSKQFYLSGFDSHLMANRWRVFDVDPDGTPGNGDEYQDAEVWGTGGSGSSSDYLPKQNWTAQSGGLGTAYNAFLNGERWPSLSVPVPLWPGGPSVLTWAEPKDVDIQWNSYTYDEDHDPLVVSQNWYTDNPWHDGNEYVTGEILMSSSNLGHVTEGDGIGFTNTNSNLSFYGTAGLMGTFRVVHPNAPGDIEWHTYHSGGETVTGTILGPGAGSTLDGDFDGDGDVDADDVDDLCANMGGDVGTYDMDGDGDVDEDDMTFHVENYLEYDSDGDGNPDGQGTFRGDFNTDGSVNGTDLSILSGGFGTTTGFAGGNANCDATVNGTDLSILSGVFGNVATAAVPEPLTIGLLSLGSIAMLRRRK